jgi:hypothetical protein
MTRALAACEEAGVRVRIRHLKMLPPLCMAGYFCWPDKTIDIAAKGRSSFQTFVHEYAHLEQSLAGMWIDREEDKKWTTFDAWIAHVINPRPARLEECVRTIQACERDAERRVLHYAKKEGFPTINIERYTRGANVYIKTYEAARRTRKWPKRQVCRSPVMMALVRGDRLCTDFESLPRGFVAKYLRFC